MNKHTAELLEKHFDTAFASPDGIKKLRELILTLAMQGKLVPQDPSEQPTGELLKEIAAEKQRLVKEGKIKKPKPLPPVTEEEKPYSLPQGWEWTRIGAIGNVFNGNSINAGEKESKYVGVEGLPYIATKDVGYGFEALDYNNGIYIPLDEEKFRVAHEGAVLICAEGGSAGKKCGLTDRDICFGNKLFANELYGRIPSRFILYVYLSPIFRASFIAAMTGIIGGVSIAKFVEIPIPLPPLEEQHRVVSKINELMARCDELEKLRTAQQGARLTVHTAAIKQLLNIAKPDQHQRAQAFLAEHFSELYTVKENVAELRKAILQLAVMGKLVPQNPVDQPASELLQEIEAEKQRLVKEGKIKKPKPLPPVTEEEKLYALPQGWEWVRFGEIVSTRLGKMLDKSKNKGESKPYLRNTNVQWHKFFLDDLKEMKFEEKELEEFLILPGDLLICEGGEPGRCAIWNHPELEIYFQKAIHRARPFLGVAPEYLEACLTKDARTNALDKYFTGATIKHFPGDKLCSYVIPLPPFQEQRRIIKEIHKLTILCDSLDQRIDATTAKQTELLTTLTKTRSHGNAAEEPQRTSRSKTQVIDLASYRTSIGCYAISKLATAQYFGRTAAAKVLYLAQAHVGLELDLKPEREAAGPLDTWIYDFERQGQGKRWFEINEKTLANGRKKTEYRCLSALSEPAAKAEALMTLGQKAEFDRLIHTLADKKTEEVEIIATLFAVWNDFLIDGVQPTDAQIISDVRENWHERKARFTPAELGRWLDWLRRENMIPQGLPPRTVQQSRLNLDG